MVFALEDIFICLFIFICLKFVIRSIVNRKRGYLIGRIERIRMDNFYESFPFLVSRRLIWLRKITILFWRLSFICLSSLIVFLIDVSDVEIEEWQQRIAFSRSLCHNDEWRTNIVTVVSLYPYEEKTREQPIENMNVYLEHTCTHRLVYSSLRCLYLHLDLDVYTNWTLPGYTKQWNNHRRHNHLPYSSWLTNEDHFSVLMTIIKTAMEGSLSPSFASFFIARLPSLFR